ncbi:MAG: cytochrome c [Lysobacterales bacterium]|nr:MAG: cytochrome c [Xanthomonadales bacterium]
METQMRNRTVVVGLAATLVTSIGAAQFEAVSLADYSGEEIFLKYCSACHGESGRGDGPVARSLVTAVPDLTAISRRYGEFPTTRIADTIDGRGPRIDAHGTRAMPVWGYEFWIEEGGDVVAQREMKEAIAKLVDYVRSIQGDPRAEGRE